MEKENTQLLSENEQAINRLKEESDNNTFECIKLLILGAVFVMAFAVFIVFGGEDNDTVELNRKNLMSGKYTESLENKYKADIPFEEQVKSLSERISFCFGIGNKISKKTVEEETDSVTEEEPVYESSAPDPSEKLLQSEEQTKHSETEKKTSETTGQQSKSGSKKQTDTALSRSEEEETSEETEEKPQDEPQVILPSTNNTEPSVTSVTTVKP